MPREHAGSDPQNVAHSSRHRRTIARSVVLLGLAFAALTVVTAGAARPRVSFVNTPQRVVQGSRISVTVAAPSGAVCTLLVRYRGGAKQGGLGPARSVSGRTTWSWGVALSTRAGTGTMSASCGRAGRASRSLVVVGQLIAPTIAIVRDGFSVRPHDYGDGSDVSYGVILRNRSPNADALNVNVLVNFVMANNKLLGSKSTNLTSLRAGSMYAFGDNMSFPGAAPIARLEIVIQIGDHQPGTKRMPAIGNVVVEPDQFKPAWVGDVAGELINTDARLTLQNAQLSAVVFDRQGNVVGGGNGSSSFTLPPGTRAIFKLTQGFNAIPTAQADSAVVSVVPSYKQS
jgi:hypothetical protein